MVSICFSLYQKVHLHTQLTSVVLLHKVCSEFSSAPQGKV